MTTARRLLAGIQLAAGLIAVSIGLTSCRPKAIFYSYQPISGQMWSRTDTLRFDLPHVEDASLWQVSVGVRCTNRLEYQDLWLVVEQRTAVVKRDTLHIIMADLNGQWLSLNPILHTTEQPACTISLATPESQLLVYHVMRPFTVSGISEVGIKVEPSSAFHSVPARINTQQDEQQEGETEKAAAAITEERQRDADDGSQP